MQRDRNVRFEVTLQPARHRELEELSRAIGVSPRDLARLAIVQLLARREVLLGRPVAA